MKLKTIKTQFSILNYFYLIVTEFSGEEDMCFGYVISPFKNELGYFSLQELSSAKGPFRLAIKGDLSFKAIQLSLIKEEI